MMWFSVEPGMFLIIATLFLPKFVRWRKIAGSEVPTEIAAIAEDLQRITGVSAQVQIADVYGAQAVWPSTILISPRHAASPGVDGVLAHEWAHLALRHTRKMQGAIAAFTGLWWAMAAFFWSHPMPRAALWLGLVFGILPVVVVAVSRHHEWQADAFVAECGLFYAIALKGTLLFEAELHPDSRYGIVRAMSTHPPLLARAAHMEALIEAVTVADVRQGQTEGGITR